MSKDVKTIVSDALLTINRVLKRERGKLEYAFRNLRKALLNLSDSWPDKLKTIDGVAEMVPPSDGVLDKEVYNLIYNPGNSPIPYLAFINECYRLNILTNKINNPSPRETTESIGYGALAMLIANIFYHRPVTSDGKLLSLDNDLELVISLITTLRHYQYSNTHVVVKALHEMFSIGVNDDNKAELRKVIETGYILRTSAIMLPQDEGYSIFYGNIKFDTNKMRNISLRFISIINSLHYTLRGDVFRKELASISEGYFNLVVQDKDILDRDIYREMYYILTMANLKY